MRSILKRSEKIDNMQGMILTKPQFHFTNIVSSWHEEKILAVDTLKSFFRYEYLLSKSKYERLNSVKWFFVGSPSNSEQPKLKNFLEQGQSDTWPRSCIKALIHGRDLNKKP